MQFFTAKNIVYSLFFASILIVLLLIAIFYQNSLSEKNIVSGRNNITSELPLNINSFKPSNSSSDNVLAEETITKINHSSSNSIDTSRDGNFNMLFTGDNMLGRSIAERIENGEDPYMGVKEFLQSYNLVYANFETSMGEKNEGKAQTGKAYTFKTPLKTMEILKNANISILGLANNHIRDYGSDVLSKMLDRFESNGFTYFGAGKNTEDAFKVKYLEYEGTKLAFLGINGIEGVYNDAKASTPGGSYFDDTRIKALLKEAKLSADVVIVVPHFGTERSKTSNNFQKKYAHMFVDNGADIVIGMHAHVIQDTEKYKGKYIYYSLGNYVFEEGPITNTGLNIGITIKDKKISEIKEYEIKIKNSFPDTTTFKKIIQM
ncbi:MAG: CapA family protein [bacterium]